MILYHGTTNAATGSIMRDGIRPRGDRASNWIHTIPSNPDCVYLTDIYAPHFAFNATRNDDMCAIIEVDTDRLEPGRLLPDEDCLEQGTRNLKDAVLKGKPMVERTTYFRDRLEHFAQYWEVSVNYLGTCCHKGVIPPSAITRVAIYSIFKNPILMTFFDPQITILNHTLCSARYAEVMRWIFDGKGDPDVIAFDTVLNEEARADPFFANVIAATREAMDKRSVVVIPGPATDEYLADFDELVEAAQNPTERL